MKALTVTLYVNDSEVSSVKRQLNQMFVTLSEEVHWSGILMHDLPLDKLKEQSQSL